MSKTWVYEDVGQETLERVGKLERVNAGMVDALRPYIGREVLEVGCGVGNITERLLPLCDRLVAVDIEPEYVRTVEDRFGGNPHFSALLHDLSSELPSRPTPGVFDTVVCLNVLEHIEDHVTTLRNMKAMLRPGGRLILLVPAYPWLYGTLDEALHHYRRYAPRELKSLLRELDFSVERVFFLNLFGILGWWLNGKVLKRTLLPEGQLALYDKLVPVFRALESATGTRMGQSVVAVARA
jgi:2-polyprenyl-3-methyl-5-hydroxy-6-metoxy-1,4-benzoquinol methylase